MSPKLDFFAIAERIRALVPEQAVDATAHRLGIDAEALGRAIDPSAPRPTVFVLVAIARTFGIDPTWLLYGRYDVATHAAALEKGWALGSEDFLQLSESPRVVGADEPPEQRPRFQLEA